MFFVCKLPWLFDRIHVRSWTHRFEHGKSACTWIWRQLVVPSLERNPGFFLLNFSNCWLDLTCHLLHAPWTWIIFGEFGITKSNGPKIPKSAWSQGMSPNISAKTKSAHQRPRMPWFYPFWQHLDNGLGFERNAPKHHSSVQFGEKNIEFNCLHLIACSSESTQFPTWLWNMSKHLVKQIESLSPVPCSNQKPLK